MINDMRKLFILFSVIALAACGGSDDVEPTSRDVPSPRLLTVEVSENPMQDESASAREITRAGGAITTSSLDAFSMVSSQSKTGDILSFSKDGEGKWKNVDWPYGAGGTDKLDFYAYNAGTPNWGSAPYISFTVEENVANQKDFLVAKHENISYNDNSGIVTLSFDHACAAVQFFVYKEESANYTVSSIILRNVCKQGDYYYNNTGATPKWQNVGTPTYYTLTTTSIDKLSTTPKRLDCGWLYLIPQSKSDITIEVTYSKAGADPKTKTLNLSSGTWEAGKQYTVNIRIGGSAS